MAVKFEKHHAEGSVEVKHPDGSVNQKKETVEEAVFTGPTANVGFSLSHTKNLGNYESLRVNISLNLPCEPNEEVIDAAFKQVSNWVDNKMAEVQAEMGE